MSNSNHLVTVLMCSDVDYSTLFLPDFTQIIELYLDNRLVKIVENLAVIVSFERANQSALNSVFKIFRTKPTRTIVPYHFNYDY